MEAYLKVFVNIEQNYWARLLLIDEFAYNNAKNTSTGHTPFELNCGYHPHVFFEKDVDPRSKFSSANALAKELNDLITICQQDLRHAQELQKRGHDKDVKLRSYAQGERSFGPIANTSRQSEIGSSKPIFLGLSEFYILWATQPIR